MSAHGEKTFTDIWKERRKARNIYSCRNVQKHQGKKKEGKLTFFAAKVAQNYMKCHEMQQRKRAQYRYIHRAVNIAE